jgi:hypothetical protein
VMLGECESGFDEFDDGIWRFVCLCGDNRQESRETNTALYKKLEFKQKPTTNDDQ